jgi:hypothetical protein
MRRNDAVLIAALALAAALPSWAQDAKQEPPKKDETPTFEDLKNSLGDLQEKQAREDNEKRDALVQKNQEDTLRIYSDTLGKRNGEVMNVSRRLEINKTLTAKYTKLLEQSRGELAHMRSQYVNRTMALKRSQEEGKISKEAYEKLLEDDTKRFRNREKELVEDIAFYEEELRTADKMSKDLSVKKELMEFDPFADEQPEAGAPKGPKPGIAEKLQKTIAEVGGYRTRSVMDLVK